MSAFFVWKGNFFLLGTVLAILLPTTCGQSYYFSINRNQRQLFSGEEYITETQYNINNNNNNGSYIDSKNNNKKDNESTSINFDAVEKDNSTIIVVKNVRKKSSELSETAMDIITIVWYIATFLALASFFLLMACSDRRCSDANRNRNGPNDGPVPPPTPTPSYSEFAPPSYETVMKMQQACKGTSIFVIPLPFENDENKELTSNNNSNNLNTSSAAAAVESATTTPVINIYTVNEVQKIGN